MPILTNETSRAWTLPVRHAADGSPFAVVAGSARVVSGPHMLDAGASLPVPDWYLEELRREPGFAAVLDRKGGLTVLAPPPAAPVVHKVAGAPHERPTDPAPPEPEPAPAAPAAPIRKRRS